MATAIATVTVDGPAKKGDAETEQVPVSTVRVLAGAIPGKPVGAVQVSSSSVSQLLPPGEYLLLLGRTNSDGVYFLSDGLRGSFALEGDQAFQRCANDADPDHPTLVKAGITNVAALAAVFDEAFSRMATAGATAQDG